MKRTLRLVLFLVCAVPLALWAQDDTRLTVSSKKQVMVGERFQVVFEANAEGKNFSAPSFDGFTVVGGPFTSSSSSFSMVNGSMSHTIKNTYTYALQAYKEGTFHIGSASLNVKGNKITSEPFDIKVVPDDGSHQSTPAATGSGQGQTQSSNDPQVSGKDLFLRVIPSKKSVYVGEQVILTYKLYTKVPVSSLSVSKMPSYAGAWTKDISDNNGGALRQTSEYVNGVEYTVAEIQKMVIVPQRSGKFVVDPMSIECLAQVRTQSGNGRRGYDPFEDFFNDSFFNRNYVNVKKELTASPLTIDVKNMPVEGRPDAFAGAVGNYTFNADIDKTELSTNDAFTLTLTVSGTGNIELLQMPEPVFPPDFEIYDPKVTATTDVTSQGLAGTKKAEYLVIPRRAGSFTLPAIEFAYFNPANNAYNTLKSQPFEINVTKGAGGDDNNNIYASNQEGIKYLGSDIRHIETGNAHLKPAHSLFFGSTPYYVVLLALLLAFLIALLVSKNREKMKQDTAATRNKKAERVAKGRLKKAFQYLKVKDQDHFYVEMSQALWGYIADKMGIEQSKLSMDTVSEAMKEKNVDEELTNQFVEALNSCEFARFAPGNAEAKMDDLYQKGLEVITKAEKRL